MRVLVIAARSALQNKEDWLSAMTGHQVAVLDGVVTVREALGRIASGEYELVHFAGHGDMDTLVVSDGVIPGNLLEDALRAAGGVELVILGACRSVTIGAMLYMAGVPRVLSWRDEVSDEVAGLWARTFYQSLALSKDIWEATLTAGEEVRRTGAETPIYLNGRMAVLEAEVVRLKERSRFGGLAPWLAGVLMVYGVAIAVLLVGMLGR